MPKVDLNKKTIREVHLAILATKSKHQAACMLGIKSNTLDKHLAIFGYKKNDQREVLTYKIMKEDWATEAYGEVYWGKAYDEYMVVPKVDISKKTIREIHQAVLANSSMFNAASILGVSQKIFENHMKNIRYLDENKQQQILNYDAIRRNWPTQEEGAAYWGEAYDQPFRLENNQKPTIREIHRVILASNKIKDAAIQLGFTKDTLSDFLEMFKYYDHNKSLHTLTYDAMKKEWPDEQEGAKYWGIAYDKPMEAPKIDLARKTLREIHQVIFISTSLYNAACRLGVTVEQLKKHLRNYRDKNDKPLTYRYMKREFTSELKAKAFWGVIYDRALELDKGDLSTYTMRKIHQAILVSTSLADASIRLGVAKRTLEIHLAKFRYLDENNKLQILSFNAMQTLWPTEEAGLEGWGDAYDKLMQAPKVYLDNITLREIHKAILASRSLIGAAGMLAVTPPTLERHLGSYQNENDQHEALTYEMIKKNWQTEEAGMQHWKEAYDKPMRKVKVILSKKTIREIHNAILASRSLKNAAALLGVSINTLRGHLANFNYRDEKNVLQKLTYGAIRKMWPNEEEGQAYWQAAYDEPMQAPEVDISKRTIREIHRAILTSKSFSEAATELSVGVGTLKTHLGGFKYLDANNQTKSMTYMIMKTNWLNEEAGLEKWKDAYDKPMPFVKGSLTKTTIRAIHTTILNSDTLCDAACALGVHSTTLKNHLEHFKYLDANNKRQFLTYEAMKTVWPNEEAGSRYWGTAYDENMRRSQLYIFKKPLREIHEAILMSASLKEAAHRLSTYPSTLNMHLKKFKYLDFNNQQESLTYETIKLLWPDVASGLQFWNAAYDDCTRITRTYVVKKTAREIHQAILATDTLFDAANELGIGENALKLHLYQFSYEDSDNGLQPLTYEVLKTDWINEQLDNEYWKENYDKPFDIIEDEEESESEHLPSSPSSTFVPGSPANNGLFAQSKKRAASQLVPNIEKSFSEIAKIIQETSSEDEAANRLETTVELLRNALLQVNLGYDDIKEDTPLYKIILDTEADSLIIISTNPKRIASQTF